MTEEERVWAEAYEEHMATYSALQGYRIVCIILLIAFGASLVLHLQ